MLFRRLMSPGPSFETRVLITPFIVFAFLRLLWVVANLDGLTNLTWGEMFMAFLVGLRFDATTAGIYCGFATLVAFFPFYGFLPRWARWLALFLLFAGIMLSNIFNIVDIGYFRFAGRRGAHDLLSVPGDVGRAGGSIIAEYWRLAVLWISVGVTALLWVSYAPVRKRKFRYSRQWALWVFVVGANVFFGRGGWQGQTLQPAQAFFSEKAEAGHIAGNSGYLAAYTLLKDYSSPTEIMDSVLAAEMSRSEIKGQNDRFLSNLNYPFWRTVDYSGQAKNDSTKPNVLILVLESLTGRYAGAMNGLDAVQSLTPNFDRYAKQGLLFDNFYSNGTRSIEAFPGILNGTPEVLGQFIISSPCEPNNNRAFGKIFNQMGYQTSFFHGTANGSMGLNGFSNVCGIQKYYGMNEYPDAIRESHFDGEWGIFDHYFYDFMYNELAKTPQPFASVLFSLSHHHPFKLPSEAEFDDIRNSNLTLPEKTLKYSDRALGKLLDKLKADPRFDNTIIMVTGDHPFLFRPQDRRHALDQFRVPLLILSKDVKPGVSHLIGKHTDIIPTLIQMLGRKEQISNVGVSLLDSTATRSALFGLGGLYTFVNDSLALTTNFRGYENWLRRAAPSPAFDYQHYEPKDEAPQEERHRKRAEALFQTSRNALLENRMVPR